MELRRSYALVYDLPQVIKCLAFIAKYFGLLSFSLPKQTSIVLLKKNAGNHF